MLRFATVQVHVSWVIASLCIGFVAGVALTQYLGAQWWWLVVAAGVLGCVGFWLRSITGALCALVAGLCLGLFVGAQGRSELARFEPYYVQPIVMSGIVTEDPTSRERGEVAFTVSRPGIGEATFAGEVWVSMRTEAVLKRGDHIVVRGVLSEGFGVYAGALYSARLESSSRLTPGDIGVRVRDWFSASVRRSITEPQASLGIGFLTGQKSALPQDLAEALQVAGLSHIVVASGYNLTILVRLARRLLVRSSKFLASFGAGLMIVSFMVVTGLSPSMARAGLVSGMSLLAWYYGRTFHPLVILPLAAAITVAFQPSYAWGDIGWLLSFTAFAGVMILAPLLQAYFFGDTPPGTVRQVLGETVAAHLATLPIVAVSFGVISHVAVIANVLIVPFVPVAMLLTFIAGLAGALLPTAIAGAIGQPASWLLGYMTNTAQWLAELPWAQSAVAVPWWAAGLFYVGLVALVAYMLRATKYSLRTSSIVD